MIDLEAPFLLGQSLRLWFLVLSMLLVIVTSIYAAFVQHGIRRDLDQWMGDVDGDIARQEARMERLEMQQGTVTVYPADERREPRTNPLGIQAQPVYSYALAPQDEEDDYDTGPIEPVTLPQSVVSKTAATDNAVANLRAALAPTFLPPADQPTPEQQANPTRPDFSAQRPTPHPRQTSGATAYRGRHSHPDDEE